MRPLQCTPNGNETSAHEHSYVAVPSSSTRDSREGQ